MNDASSGPRVPGRIGRSIRMRHLGEVSTTVSPATSSVSYLPRVGLRALAPGGSGDEDEDGAGAPGRNLVRRLMGGSFLSIGGGGAPGMVRVAGMADPAHQDLWADPHVPAPKAGQTGTRACGGTTPMPGSCSGRWRRQRGGRISPLSAEEGAADHRARDAEREWPEVPPPVAVLYIQPSCFRLTTSFQILVMWRIRSPSKSMTYT